MHLYSLIKKQAAYQWIDCIYIGRSYSAKLVYYFTKLLSQFTSGFLQNGSNCVQKNHRSQQVGFK